jgi:CubicO group peptidase (beta-lactamase class C family)
LELKVTPPAVKVAQAEPAVTAQIKAALPELEKFATDTLKKTGVPGMAIAVVYKDQVVYLKGFGVREAEGADLVCRVANEEGWK